MGRLRYLVLLLVVGLMVGAFAGGFWFALCGGVGLTEWRRPLVGTLIGSGLGVTASTFIWFLTWFDREQRDAKGKRDLLKALWNELFSLQSTLYREAQWWYKELADTRFGATEQRLMEHLQSSLLPANLSKITELPMRQQDPLLTLNTNLRVLQQVADAFYPTEDKIIAHEKDKTLAHDDANEHLQRNKAKMFHALLRTAAQTRQVVRILGEGNNWEKGRKKTFTPEAWEKRKKEEDEMNALLDKLAERYL